ncbi:MAG: class I SAM-dependent methyltransferase [Dehalococcoidia bacterium]
MAVELSEADRRIAQRLGHAQTILDVGCGDGRLTWYLALETRRQVIGLDLSDAGFSKAKKLASKAGVGQLVQCERGDVRHLDFPDGQFDVVILAYTLHHIEDTPAALREIRRVLRPGGTITVSEFEVKEGEKKGGCYQFSPSELAETLVEAGFGDIRWERAEDDVLLVAASKAWEALWTKEKSWRY